MLELASNHRGVLVYLFVYFVDFFYNRYSNNSAEVYKRIFSVCSEVICPFSCSKLVRMDMGLQTLGVTPPANILYLSLEEPNTLYLSLELQGTQFLCSST